MKPAILLSALLLAVAVPASAVEAPARPRPDLTPGAARTYIIETTSFAKDGTPKLESVFTLELTTAVDADGAPMLRYRSISMSGRENSELSRVLVAAFNRTPIALRLNATGRPVGFSDWPAQRQRWTAAIRDAGRDFAIDAEPWARRAGTWSEADAMVFLVDEVRLLAFVQYAPDQADVEVSTYSDLGQRPDACAIAVARTGIIGSSPGVSAGMRVAERIDAEGLLSQSDGWTLSASVRVETRPSEGDGYTQRYVYRLLNPPACPGVRP